MTVGLECQGLDLQVFRRLKHLIRSWIGSRRLWPDLGLELRFVEPFGSSENTPYVVFELDSAPNSARPSNKETVLPDIRDVALPESIPSIYIADIELTIKLWPITGTELCSPVDTAMLTDNRYASGANIKMIYPSDNVYVGSSCNSASYLVKLGLSEFFESAHPVNSRLWRPRLHKSSRLADLAPGVFLPGYAGMLQARQNLIPVVARTLARFSHERPKVAFMEPHLTEGMRDERVASIYQEKLWWSMICNLKMPHRPSCNTAPYTAVIDTVRNMEASATCSTKPKTTPYSSEYTLSNFAVTNEEPIDHEDGEDPIESMLLYESPDEDEDFIGYEIDSDSEKDFQIFSPMDRSFSDSDGRDYQPKKGVPCKIQEIRTSPNEGSTYCANEYRRSRAVEVDVPDIETEDCLTHALDKDSHRALVIQDLRHADMIGVSPLSQTTHSELSCKLTYVADTTNRGLSHPIVQPSSCKPVLRTEQQETLTDFMLLEDEDHMMLSDKDRGDCILPMSPCEVENLDRMDSSRSEQLSTDFRSSLSSYWKSWRRNEQQPSVSDKSMLEMKDMSSSPARLSLDTKLHHENMDSPDLMLFESYNFSRSSTMSTSIPGSTDFFPRGTIRTDESPISSQSSTFSLMTSPSRFPTWSSQESKYSPGRGSSRTKDKRTLTMSDDDILLQQSSPTRDVDIRKRRTMRCDYNEA